MTIITVDFWEFVDYAKRGSLLLYPTETVYGIGCIITQEDKIAEIRKIKSRPEGQGVIIVAGCWSQVSHLVEENIKGLEESIEETWPFATTYLFKPQKDTPRELVDHRYTSPTVAIRLVKQPLLREILINTGPLVSTSANFHGFSPSMHFKDLDKSLINLIDVAFKNDQILSGKESKILDFETKKCFR